MYTLTHFLSCTFTYTLVSTIKAHKHTHKKTHAHTQTHTDLNDHLQIKETVNTMCSSFYRNNSNITLATLIISQEDTLHLAINIIHINNNNPLQQ